MTSTCPTPGDVALAAARLRALAAPARLHILDAPRAGERTVGELVAATGYGTADVSKHHQLLHASGFATRRQEGLYVRYGLASDDVFRICEIMCGCLQAEAEARPHREAVTPSPRGHVD